MPPSKRWRSPTQPAFSKATPISTASSSCRRGRPWGRAWRSPRGFGDGTILRSRPNAAIGRLSLLQLPVARVPDLVAPHSADASGMTAGPYAVIHAAPMFRYKQWTKQGWRELAAALAARGLMVIATGSPGEAERRYLDELWGAASVPVRRVDGQLEWPQLAGLLSKASVYIGADTSVTHLAAASGCPTVALFGPTDPRLWGPWPVGGLDTIWAATGTIQRRGNVWLVQNALPCTPCQLEGCERRLDSYSQCLDELSPGQVIAAADQALAAAKR